MRRTQILFCTAVLALLAAACTRELQPADPGLFSIGATLEGDATNSTVTDAGAFAWSDGDAMSYYNGSGFSSLSLTAGAGTSDGTFSGTLVGTFQKVAIVPETLTPSLSGDVLTLNLPETIAWTDGEADNYQVAKGFADGATDVSFKNIGGLVKLTLKGVPAGAEKMVFSTPGKNITGAFTLDITATEPVIETAAGANDHVTFTFDALAAATDMVFYVPVPLTTASDKYTFKFEVKDGTDATLWEFAGTTPNEITRGKLLLMPELSFVSIGGGGESSTLSLVIPSNFDGDWFLPKTKSNVSVKMNNTAGTINIKYATGATAEEKPANVYLEVISGTIATLDVDLADSHVELAGTGTISSVGAHTSVSTLVLKPGVEVGTLTINGGNAKIEGTISGKIVIPAGVTADGTNPVNVEVATDSNVAIETASDIAVKTDSGTTGDVAVTVSNGAAVVETEEGGEITVVSQSLLDLKKAFAEGGTYTMQEDIALQEALIAEEDMTVVLDLNGKTLSYGGTTTITGGLIQVKRGATLTVQDATATSTTVGNGKIVGGENAYAALQVTVKGDNDAKTAVLNINGGTIEGYYYAVTGNGSRNNTEITVNKAHIKGTCPVAVSEMNGGYGIFHPQQGTLTVKNSYTTIEGAGTGIEMRAGTLTVSSAKIIGGQDFAAKENGSGTTILGAAVSVSQHNTNLPISVTLSSGTYEGAYSLYEKDLQDGTAQDITLALKGGTYSGNIFSGECSKFISGGKYVEDPTTYLADNYRVKPETTYQVEKFVINDHVAEYKDIGSSMTVSGIYTLDADLSGSRFAAGITSAADITINLNGHSITSDSTYGTFFARASLKLTINGEGSIIDNNAGGSNVWVSSANSSVTINGGSFDAGSYCTSIYAENGTITINGGSFKCSNADSGNLDGNGNHRFLLNCKDANYKAGTAKIIVTGGKFYDFNPADNLAEGAGTNFVAAGYKSVQLPDEDGHKVWEVIAE